MTIIAAMHEPGVGTWIGPDTLVSFGGTGILGHRPKWEIGKGFAIGFSGSAASHTIMADHIHEPKVNWKPSQLWKWVRKRMTEYGFKPEEEPGKPARFDAHFLFATPTSILSMSSVGDATPMRPMEIATRGCGSDLADGAALTLQRWGRPEFQSPKMIVRQSIVAACIGDLACDGLWMNCLRLDGKPYQPNQKDLDMTWHGRDP